MGFQFRIPYATEQGICLVEQGIFWGEQGKPVRGTGKTSAVRVHRMRCESQHRSGQLGSCRRMGFAPTRSFTIDVVDLHPSVDRVKALGGAVAFAAWICFGGPRVVIDSDETESGRGKALSS